jgi:hypothetical protein
LVRTVFLVGGQFLVIEIPVCPKLRTRTAVQEYLV